VFAIAEEAFVRVALPYSFSPYIDGKVGLVSVFLF